MNHVIPWVVTTSDQQIAPLRPPFPLDRNGTVVYKHYEGNVSANTTVTREIITIPPNKIAIITHIHYRIFPSPPNNDVYVEFQILDPGNAIVFKPVVARVDAGNFNFAQQGSFATQIYVLPNYKIRIFTANFSSITEFIVQSFQYLLFDL